MIPVWYFVNAIFDSKDEPEAYVEAYVGSVSSFLMLGLTVFQLLDVFVTPIPFRLSHVFPVPVYSMLISLVTSMYSIYRCFFHSFLLLCLVSNVLVFCFVSQC